MYETQKYNAKYYQVQDSSRFNSSHAVLSLLFDYYSPSSVVDFGCGLGHWLKTAQNLGVTDLQGLDGNAVASSLFHIDPRFYRRADFENPVDLGRRFDLAMTIEVAEHLPESSAEIFVDTLTRASDVVLFSAAAPYQGGRNHFNENTPQYWTAKFARRNYVCFDILRDRIWDNPHANPAHCQNILLFVQREKAQVFASQGFEPTERPQFKYHPRWVEVKMRRRSLLMAWRRRIWQKFLRCFGLARRS